jgi:predicted acylesterase/phospholipase RssA
LHASNGKKAYKILSLDGGGTFALIQAKVLADLYPNQTGHEVLSHFDLVAGCSGGSIVAAALVEGYRPSEILELFLDRTNRLQLFSALHWRERLIRIASQRFAESPFGPKFSTQKKLDFLHRILPKTGTIALHDVAGHVSAPISLARAARGCNRQGLDILVVTYDYDRDRARMIRSRTASPAACFPKCPDRTTLAEAAHASSTAPINWFDNPAEFNGRRYWDGAMTGYNNPVLAGVTEALAAGHAPQDIGVLAIGTSTVYARQAAENESDGLFASMKRFATDLTKAGKLIIADPPDAHTFISHVILGGAMPASASECPEMRTSVVRMNPVVQVVFDPTRGQFGHPQGWSREEFDRLKTLDIATTEDTDVELIERFADDWMRGRWYNQPIRAGGALHETVSGANATTETATSMVCEIGHPFYLEAKKAWHAM